MKKTILFSLIVLFIGSVIPSGSAWSWFGSPAKKIAKQAKRIKWSAEIVACRGEFQITDNRFWSLWEPYFIYYEETSSGEALRHCEDMKDQIIEALMECQDRKNRTDDVAANDQSPESTFFDGIRRVIVDETVTWTFSFEERQCDWPATEHLAAYCLDSCRARIASERETIAWIETLPPPEEYIEWRLNTCPGDQDILREQLSQCESGGNPNGSGSSTESVTPVPDVLGCDSIAC